MNANRRLIVHIGTHKTGTSSFQESLRANQERLAECGVGVVHHTVPTQAGATTARFNLAALADLFVRPGLTTGHRLRHPADNPRARLSRAWRRWRWARDLAQRPETDLLLSAEGFCFLRTPREAQQMQTFLRRTGRRPVFLLVQRNETDWRASWASQVFKEKGLLDAQAKKRSDDRIDGEWYFDQQAIIDFWAPMGDVRRIDFDAEMAASGDVLPGLYREAGIDPEGLEIVARKNIRRSEQTGSGNFAG